MAAYVYFNGELTPETVGNLIMVAQDRINGQYHQEGKPKFILYFSTIGGHVESSFVLAEFLTRLAHFDDIDVKIVVGEDCNSAGLLLLAYLKRYNDKNRNKIGILISKHCQAILHAIGAEISTRTSKEDLKRDFDEIEERIESVLGFFSEYLTKTEIKEFKNAKNIILDHNRLSGIFEAPIIEFF